MHRSRAGRRADERIAHFFSEARARGLRVVMLPDNGGPWRVSGGRREWTGRTLPDAYSQYVYSDRLLRDGIVELHRIAEIEGLSVLHNGVWKIGRLLVLKVGRWQVSHFKPIASGRTPHHVIAAFFESQHLPSTPRGSISAKKRKAVYRRDKGLCRYCGTECEEGESTTTIDHILPLSRGGTDSVANLALACEQCNQDKGTMTLNEWTPPLERVRPAPKRRALPSQRRTRLAPVAASTALLRLLGGWGW